MQATRGRDDERIMRDPRSGDEGLRDVCPESAKHDFVRRFGITPAEHVPVVFRDGKCPDRLFQLDSKKSTMQQEVRTVQSHRVRNLKECRGNRGQPGSKVPVVHVYVAYTVVREFRCEACSQKRMNHELASTSPGLFRIRGSATHNFQNRLAPVPKKANG